MVERARIIKAADLAQMRAAETTLREAQAAADALLAETRDKAEAEAAAVIATAQADAKARATAILSEAETVAQTQLDALEEEVSALVAATVARVIGDMDRTQAVKAATKTALADLSTQTRAKIRAAPDVFRAVSDAVSEEADAGRQTVERVTQDEALRGDRVILSSARGHTEIGLSDQIDAVTEPWRGRA